MTFKSESERTLWMMVYAAQIGVDIHRGDATPHSRADFAVEKLRERTEDIPPQQCSSMVGGRPCHLSEGHIGDCKPLGEILAR